MFKHYCFYQFRTWWPMLLIIGLSVGLIYTYAALNVGLTYREGNENLFHSGLLMFWETMSLALIIPSILAAYIMPMFIFSYRTKLRSVDTYYQAAYQPTTIRRARMLIGLIILAISVTAAFLLGFLTFLLRYISTPEMTQLSYGTGNGGTSTVTVARLPIMVVNFLLVYLLALLIACCQYFINCFLVSLGNYVFDQICLLLWGNTFLALLIAAPALFIHAAMARSGASGIQYFAELYGLGPTGSIALVSLVLCPYLAGNTIDGALVTHAVVATIIFVLFGAGMLIATMRIKDPSGEYADSRNAAHPAIRFIPHCAALAIGFLIACVGRVGVFTAILPLFLYSLFAIAYYALLALWRHSFKPNRIDLIAYLSNIGTVLFLVLIGTIV